MRLVRDVLDNQLVDRNQVKIGKADGIIIELCNGAAPKAAYIEAGLYTKARRIHPVLARWVGRWSKAYRIPWSKVRDVGIDIDVDLNADETPLLNVERRLRELVRRLPFS